MRVSLVQSVTSDLTRSERMRKGAQLADGRTIRAMLEKMADPDKPLVIEIFGVKEDRQPNDYFMRECRGIFIFEGVAYKESEKIRLEKEGKVAVQVKRTARLAQIKSKLRAEKKADNGDFDKKYNEQTEERAEIAEAEIEKKAEVILKKEEGEKADKC